MAPFNATGTANGLNLLSHFSTLDKTNMYFFFLFARGRTRQLQPAQGCQLSVILGEQCRKDLG
jgi:hypothetical protein